MTIRFNQSQGGGFQTYDAGTYDFKIENVQQGTSKTGNPQLTVKLRFVGGKYDDKQMTAWYSLTPQSMWKMQALVEASGCHHTVIGEDAEGKPTIEFDEADLVGLVFAADVTIEEYQGKKNNRLNNERPSDLVEEARAAQQAAPEPVKQAAPAQPTTQTATMAQRRPRTVGQS